MGEASQLFRHCEVVMEVITQYIVMAGSTRDKDRFSQTPSIACSSNAGVSNGQAAHTTPIEGEGGGGGVPI